MSVLPGSQPPLRVALIGAGIIGRHHAAVMQRVDGLVLAAIVDTQAAASDALADTVVAAGGERPATFTSLTDALAGGGIDLVVLCTPTSLHVSAAEEALAAGAHVLVEKPIDVSLPRARRLAAVAQEAAARGLVCSIVSQHRFDPASVAIASAAASGELGRVTSAVASVTWWRSQDYYDSADWRGTWAVDGGGATMNQGVHTVDLLLWFLGTPVEVYAETALLAHERIEVEDVAVATFRFASGALAVLHATTSAYPGLDVHIQVHGTQGSAIVRSDRLEYFHSASRGDTGNQATELVPADQLHGADADPDAFVLGHLRQYADVVDAIRTGRAPGVTAQDGLVALAAVRAVYVSATLHRPVAVADVLSGVYDDVPVTVRQ
ncbi:MAG: UDP-N-acetyl-2-amino-2-deoxyglucuronate dehydrogenase [Frankiaceae bacterium]|jgi:predicted dehydrogenase|nr:UDP-N-acetyl-2-amino-2-deoxyglucuronate dehydrogenase [Frankiaceae bacterium]